MACNGKKRLSSRRLRSAHEDEMMHLMPLAQCGTWFKNAPAVGSLTFTASEWVNERRGIHGRLHPPITSK